MKMRPMSLWESGESSGTVSLGNLFGQGEFDGGESALTLEELAFLTCRGGWPSVVDMKGKTALDQSYACGTSVFLRTM